MGIVLSNSIASVDRWRGAREWLIQHMRLVALFDLPPNIFAETGVNTTLVIAYKPVDKAQLNKLVGSNYEIFVRDIRRVGYEVRTRNRVKYFKPLYKIKSDTFEIEINENGEPMLDEEFTETIGVFREWCVSQEDHLRNIFLT